MKNYLSQFLEVSEVIRLQFWTLHFNVMCPLHLLKRSPQRKTSQYNFLKDGFSIMWQSLKCSNCRLWPKEKEGSSSPLLQWLYCRGFYMVNCQIKRDCHWFLHFAYLIWQTDPFQIHRSIMTSQQMTLSPSIMLRWWGTKHFSCIPWELTVNYWVSPE